LRPWRRNPHLLAEEFSMKKHLLSFRMMPSSWGLNGDAYAVAEAHYDLEGEELERKLAVIAFRNDPNGLARKMLDLDRQYAYLEPYIYDLKVAELEITEPIELAMRKLDIQVKHERLSPHEAARQKVILRFRAESVDRAVALLEVDCQFGHLTKQEFEKQRAILRDQPWVAIVNSGFDPEQGIDGVFFEFDWNAKWIEFLKLNGYVGHSDEQIVDDWFTDVCRSHNPAELAVVRDE
jgi:hypothetical protein